MGRGLNGSGVTDASVAAHAAAVDPHTGYVLESLFDANTVLAATTDNTPAALSVGASTFVGRKASGNISAMSVAETVALLADTMMPRRIDLHPAVAHANTNWSTISVGANILFGGYSQSSGAQNAERSWQVPLAAGTYSFILIHSRDVNRGIYSVQIDGVAAGTIDGYNGSTAHNTVDTSITGIAVAAAGVKTIALKMLTKNASSSSFFAAVQDFVILRTA